MLLVTSERVAISGLANVSSLASCRDGTEAEASEGTAGIFACSPPPCAAGGHGSG
jgi:hypothetical protein